MERQKSPDRNAGIAQQSFHHILTHPDCRTANASTDKRNTGKLKKTLHGSILSTRSMENRKNNIHHHLLFRGGQSNKLTASTRHKYDILSVARQCDFFRVLARKQKREIFVESPYYVFSETVEDWLVICPIERLHDIARRKEGDLVFR